MLPLGELEFPFEGRWWIGEELSVGGGGGGRTREVEAREEEGVGELRVVFWKSGDGDDGWKEEKEGLEGGFIVRFLRTSLSFVGWWFGVRGSE